MTDRGNSLQRTGRFHIVKTPPGPGIALSPTGSEKANSRRTGTGLLRSIRFSKRMDLISFCKPLLLSNAIFPGFAPDRKNPILGRCHVSGRRKENRVEISRVVHLRPPSLFRSVANLLNAHRTPILPEVKQITPIGRKTDRAFHPAVVAEFHTAPATFAEDSTMRLP